MEWSGSRPPLHAWYAFGPRVRHRLLGLINESRLHFASICQVTFQGEGDAVVTREFDILVIHARGVHVDAPAEKSENQH